MPDSALAARIDAAVDANFDAEIAFLQELVRCPCCAARRPAPKI